MILYETLSDAEREKVPQVLTVWFHTGLSGNKLKFKCKPLPSLMMEGIYFSSTGTVFGGSNHVHAAAVMD